MIHNGRRETLGSRLKRSRTENKDESGPRISHVDPANTKHASGDLTAGYIEGNRVTRLDLEGFGHTLLDRDLRLVGRLSRDPPFTIGHRLVRFESYTIRKSEFPADLSSIL